MSSIPLEVFPMKDDPFIFLKNTSFTLLYSKIGKVVTKFSIILHIIVIFMQLDYIKNDLNFDLIIETGPGILIVIYLMSATAVLIVYESNVKDVFLQLTGIGWNLCDPHIEKVAKSDLFSTKIWFLILNFLIGICATCWYIEEIQNDSATISFVPKMFQEYFGSASIYLLLLYLATLIIVTYIGCLIFINFTFYVCCHCKIQIALLNKCIYEISNYGTDEMDLYHSGEYQNEIYKILCFCIEHHITINKLLKEINAKSHNIYLIVAIIGFVTNISTFVLLFSNMSFDITPRLLFVTTSLLIASCIILILSEASQKVTDETESTFELLCSCPWYNWNTKNRKALLLFMMNTSVPYVFSIGGIFEVNLEFLKKFVQCSYSTGTIFYRLQEN